jgi:hypothetical protein
MHKVHILILYSVYAACYFWSQYLMHLKMHCGGCSFLGGMDVNVILYRKCPRIHRPRRLSRLRIRMHPRLAEITAEARFEKGAVVFRGLASPLLSAAFAVLLLQLAAASVPPPRTRGTLSGCVEHHRMLPATPASSSEVAEQICEHDTLIWRVVDHYVKKLDLVKIFQMLL